MFKLDAAKNHWANRRLMIHSVPLQDAGDDIGEIDLRVDAVELAGLHKRRDGCPMFSAAVRACEERILAIEGDRPDCAFDDIVIDLDAVIVDEQRQAFPARQRVSDRFREFRLLTDCPEFSAQPGFEGVDDRAALLLPN